MDICIFCIPHIRVGQQKTAPCIFCIPHIRVGHILHRAGDGDAQTSCQFFYYYVPLRLYEFILVCYGQVY